MFVFLQKTIDSYHVNLDIGGGVNVVELFMGSIW